MKLRINHSEKIGTRSTKHRRADVIAIFFTIVLSFSTLFGYGQQMPRSLDLDTISSMSEPDNTTVRNSLTANQIIELVHAKPELAVELKKLMADQLEQQGYQIQEDSITDEMLFSRIVSDANLRGAITNWLRARGYINEADFQRPSSVNSGGDDAVIDSSIRTSIAQASSNPERGNMNLDQISRASANTDSNQRDERFADERITDNRYASDSTDRTLQRSSERIASDTGTTRMSLKRDEDNPSDTLQDRKENSTNKRIERITPGETEVLHQSTPYNLLSLRDLYTQVPEQSSKLKRFGADVFLNRGLPSKEMPIDLPIGPDYVVGPGDGLSISLWGGVSQNFTRVVDREGRIVLPEAGSIVVAGLTLEHAEILVQKALAQQFRNAHVTVSVAHLRTVRVYVVGDVQRPGAYDISSLSTPLNALYAAGGPTSVGSLRTVRHYRGKDLIREIDLYDFLLRGIRQDVERLEPGDTILVPPAGAQVAISGMVKRPAIYELKMESKLSEVLEEAGGVTVSAALGRILVERVAANDHRETVSLPLSKGNDPDAMRKALELFSVKDGDRVMVAPILPYSERAIYLEGHVVRPGKYSYRDDLTLSDVIRTYQDLLPEPAEHGEIVRLMPPDLRPETIDFVVSDVLTGGTPIALRPFDTVRILGRYESDAPRVTVRGEVLRPGTYALSQGMTAAKLVRMAGGFKRSALLDGADLASYVIQDGKRVVSQRSTVMIGRAVNGGDINSDALLRAGDVLTVHQISGWNDIGASVKINGEVTYPGTYGLQEGEKLSSLLQRAGGFRTTAYPTGAVLVRLQVRELEEKSRAELIHQIEATSVGAKLAPNANGQDETGTLQLLVQQQEQVLQRLRSQPATGRLVIKISGDIASWANTSADIEMRRGDVVTIPKRPGFVLVSGQVYNASAQTYVPNKDAGWYLKHAGGATDLANRKEIFVVRANGSVIGRRSGGRWYGTDVLATRLDPGDSVVVPQKIIGGSMFWRNMLSTAQVASSIAITLALAGL